MEYIKAKAWKFLLDCEINTLPIDVIKLRDKNLGFDIMSYSEGKELIKGINKTAYASQHKGFIADVDGDIVIFYDDSLSFAERNLVIAHEIAHFVLEHTGNKVILGKPNDAINSINNLEQEVEADLFALAFLAPAPILLKLNVRTVMEISRITLLPNSDARLVLEQVKRETIINRGLSAELIKFFVPFIKSYNNQISSKMILKGVLSLASFLILLCIFRTKRQGYI